jgi:NTE family protein
MSTASSSAHPRSGARRRAGRRRTHPSPRANIGLPMSIPEPCALTGLLAGALFAMLAAAAALAQPAPGAAPPAAARPRIVMQPAGAAPQRPRIGLVLSGGGARGITHIGVLKVLDELRIPIDYVAATSMGAIVGGFYAAGMPPAEMERIVTTVDWRTLFSDSPPRRELSFRDKRRDALFPLPLEIGFREGKIRGFQGALSGSNLELFLHGLTSKADGVHDFDRLPIPFRAVSTDMVTGTPYVFDQGPLYEAMRASMSIPGVFSPVDVRGHLLGDGGLVDNLPVDVVRKMGAQIVIAVNIGTPLMTRDELSSVVGLTSQMINILTEQNVRTQLASLGPGDVLISPDLGTLSAIDFRKGADFIAKGEAAARDASARLAALALPEPAYRAYLAARPRLSDTPPPVIEFVRIEGAQYANPEAIEARLDVPIGEPLDAQRLERGIARLYGSGEYDRIDYRMVDDGGHEGLVVDVHEKSIGPNYLRFGLFYATDFQGESTFALLMGHRRVWVDSLGGEWLNEIELGRITRAATEFYQPFNVERTLFGSAYAGTQTLPRYLFSGSQRVAEYSVQTNDVGVDVGAPIGNLGQIRIGPVYRYYKGSPTIAVPGFQTARQSDAGARLLARWDSLDNAFFPHQGLRANLEVFYGRQSQRYGSGPWQTVDSLARADLFANGGIPLTENSFLNVAGHLGGLSRDEPSIVNPFLLGGLFNLSGLRDGQLAGSYLGFGRVVFYYRVASVPLIGGSVYAGGSAEAGNTWQLRSDVSAGDLVKAGSVFLAADTFLGPFYFAYGRASGGASSFYLYLGRPQ